ncbi:MAG: 3-dehydroquinate synthase [Planctomycetota bacterium]|jgi:3-dehydroquinate synthase
MAQNGQKLDVVIPGVEASSYPITIGHGTLSGVWGEILQTWPKHNPFIVTDSELVKAGHLQTLVGSETVPTYTIDPAGEVSKHIQTVVEIVETMEKNTLGRDTVVIALGGGTVGDIAGFAAAIFKRGEYRAGLVESVKHAAIMDAEYFGFFETNIDAILNKDMAVLEQIATTNCRIKAEVVQQDPTEKNMRRILNYGHTIGHAVESASSFELLHGESVAIGMIAAGKLEKALGLADDDRLERITNLLVKLGMPTRIPADITKEKIIDLLRTDKKAVGKWPRFVLLESLGAALCRDGQWAHEVSQDVVEQCLDEL